MKPTDLIDNNSVYGDGVVPYLVEVTFREGEDEKEGFLKVRETLTRIGIPSRTEDKTLFQTCHILQKRGKYYIVHFKTLFVIDGRENNVTIGDIARQNRIIQLLVDWNLVSVVDPEKMAEPMAGLSSIRIVKHGEKDEWTLVPKYRLGGKKKQ